MLSAEIGTCSCRLNEVRNCIGQVVVFKKLVKIFNEAPSARIVRVRVCMEDVLQKIEKVRVGAIMEKLKRIISGGVSLRVGEFHPTM